MAGLTHPARRVPSPRPPSRSERGRLGLFWIGNRDQVDEIDPERLRQPVEDVHGRVELLALNAADIGAIHAGIDGQILLRERLRRPDASQIPRHARSSIHGRTRPTCETLKHRICSTQFRLAAAAETAMAHSIRSPLTAPEHATLKSDHHPMRHYVSVALTSVAFALAVAASPANAQTSTLTRIRPGTPNTEAQPRTPGTAENPAEAVGRRNREAYEGERQERARLDALGSSGADVMRRSREIQAEQQRAFEAAQAEAAKPENMMLTAYRNYLVARQCFESRTGFAAVYLTPPQMEEAKVQVKAIETVIKKGAPGLNTDERWTAANQLETAANGDMSELGFTGRGPVKERVYTEQGRQFCAAATGWLRQVFGFANPDSLTVKKDF